MVKVRSIAEIDADIAQTKEDLQNVRGTETEVYSRIVGYYRSVRNWNKGKRDEYNHRKQFININCDCALPEYTPQDENCVETAVMGNQGESGKNAGSSLNFYNFFGRASCPNCPPVRQYLEGIGLNGAYIDVDTEAGLAQAAKMGVFAAPTVILFDEAGQETGRAHNIEEVSAVLLPHAEQLV